MASIQLVKTAKTEDLLIGLTKEAYGALEGASTAKDVKEFQSKMVELGVLSRSFIMFAENKKAGTYPSVAIAIGGQWESAAYELHELADEDLRLAKKTAGEMAKGIEKEFTERGVELAVNEAAE